VLYLVARRERSRPDPTLSELLSAAATATLALLSDERARGEWEAQITQWERVSFRKVSLKARASRWEQITMLPGATATVGAAEVYAVVPMLRSQRPAPLIKAQAMDDALDDGDLASPEIAVAPTRTLWLSPPAAMTSGKAMAQVGHCAQMLRQRLPGAAQSAWAQAGFGVSVRRASTGRWERLLVRDDTLTVRDAGLTEIAPGTFTVAATIR